MGNLEVYNLELIDFNKIFESIIIPQWIDAVSEYKADGNKKLSKKLFYHVFIKETCEFLVESKTSQRKILFFCYQNGETTWERVKSNIKFDKKQFFLMLRGLILKLETILPLKFYVSKYTLIEFHKLIDKKDGMAQYHIELLRKKVNKFNDTVFSFNKVSKFSARHELTWLNRQYFTNFKTKLLILT